MINDLLFALVIPLIQIATNIYVKIWQIMHLIKALWFKHKTDSNGLSSVHKIADAAYASTGSPL